MINRCINCSYFITCTKASEEIRNCEGFKESNAEVVKIDG